MCSLFSAEYGTSSIYPDVGCHKVDGVTLDMGTSIFITLQLFSYILLRHHNIHSSQSVDIASVGTGGRLWASVKFFTHSSQEVKTVSIKQLRAFKITFLAYHYIPKI
jgi:hypothetical protein